MRTVAALYVDPRGPYPKLAGVECWDEARDARGYQGPHPIVAHPPCGPWGGLAHMAYLVNDRELAPLAVEQVRRYGGVLEHPRGSRLWDACGLPRPGELPDAAGGISIEVRQVDFGHVAEKLTWIYLVRTRPDGLVWPNRREPTHWISGRRHARKPHWKGGGIAPAHMKFCSAAQRRRTPPAFAEFLVELARRVP
jgi:hypothetical protein